MEKKTTLLLHQVREYPQTPVLFDSLSTLDNNHLVVSKTNLETIEGYVEIFIPLSFESKDGLRCCHHPHSGGTRPLLVELQAFVAPAPYVSPPEAAGET